MDGQNQGQNQGDARAKAIANLRPQRAGEPSHNPFGRRGGPDKQSARAWLDALDGDKPRIEKVLEAAYVEALAGSEVAQKTLIERRFGRPGPAEEEAALVIAEHCRKVERDRVDLALRLLGPRAYTMSSAELVKFFQECAENVRGFLAQAEERMQASGLSSAIQDGRNAETGLDQSSPKDCVTANHDPSALTCPGHPGSAAPINGGEREP